MKFTFNKKPWFWYFVVIGVLYLIGFSIVWTHYQYEKQRVELLAEGRLELITLSVTQLLQSGNYDQIQPLFETWGRSHEDIRHLSIRSRNSFVLASYFRSKSSFRSHALKKNISYGYQGQAILYYQHDLSQIERQNLVTFLAVLVALLLSSGFGYLLVRKTVFQTRLSDELDQRNQALDRGHALLQTVTDNMPDLIYFKSRGGIYQGSNRAFQKFFGIDKAHIIGHTDDQLFEADYARKNDLTDQAVIRCKMSLTFQEWMVSAEGKRCLMEALHAPYFDADGRLLGMIGISRDITELNEYQESLEQLAYHDNLTGLPNRLYLVERMKQDMGKAQREGRKLGICVLDLDGFKPINDSLGHEAGDRVLEELARRLLTVLRAEDTAARWGGDEFTLLLNNFGQREENYSYMIGRIQDEIGKPIFIDDLEVYVTSSLGVTIFPDDDSDPDTLLRHADQAMYQAKVGGKNRFSFFDTEQDRIIHAKARQVKRLMEAIELDELELYYQPQINMRTGELHGLEALVRWNHPQHGLLGPAYFLPNSENQKANIRLDNWVLEQALWQLSQWQEQTEIPQLSVNLSAATLEAEGFVDSLKEKLSVFHCGVNHLHLEVLESTSLENIDSFTDIIRRCGQLGVDFALDDFGTGYSSLTYLRRLPAQTLKIDRSFVRDMLIDRNDLLIVTSIVGLAKSFGKKVIAEGVEELELGRLLIELGVSFAQGYAIAKPMPADQVIEWVENYRIPEQWKSQAQW